MKINSEIRLRLSNMRKPQDFNQLAFFIDSVNPALVKPFLG